MSLCTRKLIVKILVLGVVCLGYIKALHLSGQNDVAFWDEAEPFGQSTKPAADLRLPQDVVPSFYRLKLRADLEKSSFDGNIAITLRANKQVKEIVLHSKDLVLTSSKLSEQIYERVAMLRTKRDADNTTLETMTDSSNVTETDAANATDPIAIDPTTGDPNATEPTTAIQTTEVQIQPVKPVDTQVTHSNAKTMQILNTMHSTGDRLVITLASVLKPNVDYVLELSFTGKIKDTLTGFYKSTYSNNNSESIDLGVTQFEPTSARAAFPCFDEPAFKAKFEISIAHSTDITVLSNMKVSTTELIPEEPGKQWTHFERSVKMSTYLVAYVLSNFKSLQTSYRSKDNVTKTIRIWARPEFLNNAEYALNITPKLLTYYEDWFGVPYALDKVDLIAIPDFASGAMENWGLITFRETTLLYLPGKSSPRDRLSVAVDVAHELAHQWFGNLVTMRWWTDLWLNEGFATYVEYMGVELIEPQWQILQTFSRDKMDLLRSDALKNTSPLSKQVNDASEISQKFDEISYAKGANLIRMLNHTITEELFRKGLLIYLNDWKYANAEENDLWEAMTKATASDPFFKDFSIVDFMNSWTRQAGYPVLQVDRNYETGELVLEQRLFSSSPDPYKAMMDQLWQIPVSYTALDAPLAAWSTKPKTWLKDRVGTEKTDLNATQALYVNVGAIGYYRVNYDQRNWALLSAAIRNGSIQSPIMKAQLIDDAFNLAKTGRLEYSSALALTTCVIGGEGSRVVWDMVLANMAFLKYNLKDDPGYEYFYAYMKLILKKQLEILNYGLDKPRDDVEAFLVENLVTWECFLETPRCLKWARGLFEDWVVDPANNTIPPYMRSLVLSSVVRHGGRREFDLLWNIYKTSSDPQLQTAIVNVLPGTRDEALIVSLLEKSLSEIPKQYAVAVWAVEPGIGALTAQNFLLSNFARVRRRFTEIDPFLFPAVLNAAFGYITTQYELDRLKSFALENKPAFLPMSQTLHKIVDTASLRIQWKNKYARGINQWFEDYMTGKLSPDGSTASNATAPTNVTVPTNATVPTNDTVLSTADTATEAPALATDISDTAPNTTDSADNSTANQVT